MSGLKEKLGIKVFVILLFSVFILTGLTVTQAYGQPLDSPLYNHTNTKAVESMDGSDANGSAAEGMGGDSKFPCFTVNNHPIEVPVMFPAGEIVFILTLTGGACWAIIRKKRP